MSDVTLTRKEAFRPAGTLCCSGSDAGVVLCLLLPSNCVLQGFKMGLWTFGSQKFRRHCGRDASPFLADNPLQPELRLPAAVSTKLELSVHCSTIPRCLKIVRAER